MPLVSESALGPASNKGNLHAEVPGREVRPGLELSKVSTCLSWNWADPVLLTQSVAGQRCHGLPARSHRLLGGPRSATQRCRVWSRTPCPYPLPDIDPNFWGTQTFPAPPWRSDVDVGLKLWLYTHPLGLGFLLHALVLTPHTWAGTPNLLPSPAPGEPSVESHHRGAGYFGRGGAS